MSPSISGPNSGQKSSFQNMLDDIKSAFNRPDRMVDVDELWRVLEDYNSNLSDWSKYAHYDMLDFKRNLVDEDENYNVMIIGWGPNTKSCIHDHSGSHCFMKILDGELIESRFAWPDENVLKHSKNEGQEMKPSSEARVGLDSVVYINDKVGLHRVYNPNPNKTSASLHVYIPPLKHCKAFDQRTGQARECKLGFYSKCGKITMEDEKPKKNWLPDCS